MTTFEVLLWQPLMFSHTLSVLNLMCPTNTPFLTVYGNFLYCTPHHCTCPEMQKQFRI